ncbi:MAG: response regulator [Nostoc sp.]|uniref:response regulator n=1 Tax=Nostoc sp. TaxID=1180 RepID=UPI002FEFDD63
MLSQNLSQTYLEEDRNFLEEISPKSSSLKDLRVLVVDDSDDCSYVMEFVLSDHQAQTKTAASVDEAIEAIKEWKPNIVISDIRMPDKDGYSLIRSVRKKEAIDGGFLPAVALTSYRDTEVLSKAINAGFQEVIRKPFEPDELVAILVKLTQGT